MQRNKIVLYTLVGIIFLGTLVFIAFKMKTVFFQENKNFSTSTLNKEEGDRKVKLPILSMKPKLNCQEGWKEYYQDVLGIAFCYPNSWGNPIVGDITDLRALKENITLESNFKNEVIIDFSGFARITLFDDKKNIEDLPYVYYESGLSKNIGNVQKTRDICDYLVEYDYRYNEGMKPGHFKTLHRECPEGILSILTQDEEFFDFDNIGMRYSYDLRLLYFGNTSNGYFDNVLVSQKIDEVSQNKEELKTLNEFFTSNKTSVTQREKPLKTKEQYVKDQREFASFIKSLVAYKPVTKIQNSFQEIIGEEVGISSIRKYYWLIDSGKLEEAYAMRSESSTSGLSVFKDGYKNTYSAEPSDFKKIAENRYGFKVNYQDQNSPKQNFWVVMEVSGQKVKTIFLEELLSEEVRFGDMFAYAARRGEKNYLILKKSGEEIIVDQGFYGENRGPLSEIKSFSEMHFSPKGNYLFFQVGLWELPRVGVYDIQKKKMIRGSYDNYLGFYGAFSFTPDERWGYLCSSSSGMPISGEGKVFSVPGFKTEFDVFADARAEKYANARAEKYANVGCSYDEKTQSVLFVVSNDYSSNDIKGDTLKLRFDLNTKKITEEQ